MPQLGQQHPGPNLRLARYNAGRDYFFHPPAADGGDYLNKDKINHLAFHY
jgi:hypothetical protein